MANPEHLEILKSGRATFNAWRDEHPDVPVDLAGADLSKMNLAYYDLDYADLRDAELRDANLRWADLRWADLQGADLRWADLQGANLWRANLRDADLRDAELIVGSLDSRGYQCLLTYSRETGKADIQFGCRRWPSFDVARAHFGPGYDSDGDQEECLLILDQLEARYNLRMKQEAGNG